MKYQHGAGDDDADDIISMQHDKACLLKVLQPVVMRFSLPSFPKHSALKPQP